MYIITDFGLLVSLGTGRYVLKLYTVLYIC